ARAPGGLGRASPATRNPEQATEQQPADHGHRQPADHGNGEQEHPVRHPNTVESRPDGMSRTAQAPRPRDIPAYCWFKISAAARLAAPWSWMRAPIASAPSSWTGGGDLWSRHTRSTIQ